MFVHKKLIKVIFVYVACFLLLNLLFSGVYYYIAIHTGHPKNTFYDWLYFAMMTFATISFGDIQPNAAMHITITIQYLTVSIGYPIATGVIFYYTLNRPPRILFPDKLIIRQRTSEKNSGKIYLTVKIANKNINKVYDIKCQLIYFYFKEFNNSVTRNGDTNLIQRVHYIDKTFRFSYPIADFPVKFLQSIIEGGNKNDFISIIVYGRFGRFGDNFLVEKTYKWENIEILKDSESLYKYTADVYGNVTPTKVKFENLNTTIRYSEDERQNIIALIKRNIEEKKKAEQERIDTQK
jgi:hypothetical protein